MNNRSTNWLAIAFLLFLCVAIPYGLHLEQQLRELLRRSQPPAPQALHLPEISNNTPTEPETQTDLELPERPAISAPNSYLESLLNDASDLSELIVVPLFDLDVGVDLCFLEDHLRTRSADPVDVGEPDLSTLVAR